MHYSFVFLIVLQVFSEDSTINIIFIRFAFILIDINLFIENNLKLF